MIMGCISNGKHPVRKRLVLRYFCGNAKKTYAAVTALTTKAIAILPADEALDASTYLASTVWECKLHESVDGSYVLKFLGSPT